MGRIYDPVTMRGFLFVASLVEGDGRVFVPLFGGRGQDKVFWLIIGFT